MCSSSSILIRAYKYTLAHEIIACTVGKVYTHIFSQNSSSWMGPFGGHLGFQFLEEVCSRYKIGQFIFLILFW